MSTTTVMSNSFTRLGSLRSSLSAKVERIKLRNNQQHLQLQQEEAGVKGGGVMPKVVELKLDVKYENKSEGNLYLKERKNLPQRLIFITKRKLYFYAQHLTIL